MPSANTTADHVSYGGLRAQASWEQHSITDTQITFRVCGSAQITQAYLYGARVEVAIDQPEGTRRAYQTSSGYSSSNPGASWGSVAETDWAYATFDRTGSDSTAYIRARAYGETTSGYGAAFANIGRVADTGWQTVGTVTILKLPTPAAPSNMTHTRVSDTQNNLSWTRNATSANPYQFIRVERRVNGGSWAQITSVAGTATSYSDTTCLANSSYEYRVRADWQGMLSGYSGISPATYNTPAVPGAPSVSRIDASTIKASFTNTGVTQTATELSRSNNGTSWTTVQTTQGASVVSINDIPGGGTWYYRARNTRSTLASAWSATSDPVVTMIAPAAPTLIAPVSGAVISKADASVAFSWIHNPIDGSAQTEAKIRHSTNGGTTWSTPVVVSGSSTTTSLANSWVVNSTVTWQMQTKGAHQDHGPWSPSSSFVVYQIPQVAITSPVAGSILADMPLGVTWSYSDVSGMQQQAIVQILSEEGTVLFSRTINGNASQAQITSGDYLPANNTVYQVKVSVRSTTSLVASTETTITTDYLEPAVPVPTLTIDRERACVSLGVFEGTTPGLPTTVSLGIMRRRKDGSLLTLTNHVSSGTFVTDIYPPLDEELTYVFVAYSATGVASMAEQTATIPSKMAAFINYGEGLRQLAKVALDANWSKALTHSREVFESAGTTTEDAYPLVFYGASKQMSGTLAGTAIRASELVDNLVLFNLISDVNALSEWTGSVVLRLPFEEPFAAAVSISQSTDNQYLSSVSVSWERVRVYGLAI